jgi:hypothetical protein
VKVKETVAFRRRPNRLKELSFLDILIFSVLIGAGPTFLSYSFGSGDQIEQLPIVMRAMDSSFLVNDFFTNVSSTFGPRFYFARFIALLGNIAPLSSVYLALTLLSNILVALITFYTARDLFGGKNLAGILAPSLVMGLRGFNLGSATDLFSTSLVPTSLAMPLIILSMWALFRHRSVLSMLSAGLASLFHPLLGLETGCILWFSSFCSEVVLGRVQGQGFRRRFGSLLVALFVLSVFAALVLLPYTSGEYIYPDQFIKVLAHLRHPHHYLPSTFGLLSYLEAIGFLSASFLAWYWWRKMPATSSFRAYQILFIAVIVLLLCLGGYIFVEIVPTRLWTTAQTFRLLLLIKWLGFVLVGGVVASRLLSQKAPLFQGLLLISALSPIAMGAAHLFQQIRDWRELHDHFLVKYLLPSLSILLVVLLFWLFPPTAGATLLFLSVIAMAIMLACLPRRLFYLLAVIVLTVLIVLGLCHEKLSPVSEIESIIGRPIGPQITFSELSGEEIEIARLAKASTPKESVFLTPPHLGHFRLIAERAIVVDFKAFPFQNMAMLDWKKRIFDCYGVPEAKGWEALKEMKQKYRFIDDAKLLALQSEYGFTYAVLYRDMETKFPIVAENDEFKIVAVDRTLQ